jgi:hypothetical protein
MQAAWMTFALAANSGEGNEFFNGMSRLISCWEECFSSPSERRIPLLPNFEGLLSPSSRAR